MLGCLTLGVCLIVVEFVWHGLLFLSLGFLSGLSSSVFCIVWDICGCAFAVIF